MKSLLINTTPHQKFLYALKKHEDKEFPLPFHMHERFELTYIIKGKGTRIIGDSVKQYVDGDVVLIAPYVSHYWQTPLVKQDSVSAITLFFSADFPTSEFQQLLEFGSIAKLLEMAKYGVELKGKLRKSIAAKIASLPNEYSLPQIMRILSILDDISQSEEYNILMNRGFTVSKNQNRERITAIVSYIRNNISNKITIQELADITYLRASSVTRFFKKSTGFALVEYINLMRIGLACQFLSGTNNSILNISTDCGFTNLSHFNRIFKRVKGTTPTAYRNQFQ